MPYRPEIPRPTAQTAQTAQTPKTSGGSPMSNESTNSPFMYSPTSGAPYRKIAPESKPSQGEFVRGIPQSGVHTDPLTGDVTFLHEALNLNKFEHNGLNWPGTPYSLEFADFINGWTLGKYRRSTFNGFTRRCFSLALKRSKNIYNFALLSIDNQFTPIGEELASDIIRMYRTAMDYRRQIDESVIPYEEINFGNVHEHITNINRIILLGKLSAQDMRMLRILYILHMEDVKEQITSNIQNLEEILQTPTIEQTPEQRIEARNYKQQNIKAAQTTEIFLASAHNPLEETNISEQFDTYQYIAPKEKQNLETLSMTRTYMDSSAFRNRPAQRRALDRLIMYGFMDITPLPRRELNIGVSGRPVAGGAITPIGKRYYELYLENFDDKFRRLTQTANTYPTHMPTVNNDYSDTINGEYSDMRQSEAAPNSASDQSVPNPAQAKTTVDNNKRVDSVTGAEYHVNPKDFKIGLLGPAPENTKSEPTPTNSDNSDNEEPIVKSTMTREEKEAWYASLVFKPISQEDARKAWYAHAGQNTPSGQIEDSAHDHEPTSPEEDPADHQDDHVRTAPPSNKEWIDPDTDDQDDVVAAQQAIEPPTPTTDPFLSAPVPSQPPQSSVRPPHRAVESSNDPYPFDLDDLPTKAHPEDHQS